MENLRNYSIYELRQIARSIGVESPSTKKFNELIEEINKAQKEPKLRTSKRGRPCKNLNNPAMNNYVKDIFKNQNNYMILNKTHYDNLISELNEIKMKITNILNFLDTKN